MSNCTHCGKKFTCGCQKTRAANGQTVCKTCKNAYDKKHGTTKTSGTTSSLTQRIRQADKNLRR